MRSDRNGADIDKNTSSRYFLGFNANRILKRHMIVTHTLKHNSCICQYIFRTDGYFFMGQQNCPICFPNTLYHSNLDSFTEEFMI